MNNNLHTIGATTGDGIYTSWKDKEAYKHWIAMLTRCYKLYNYHLDSHINCYVYESWLNFQDYCKWYYDNIYYIPGVKMQVDKDILIKGNTLYSPNTCVIVPNTINILFRKSHSNKTNDLPMGVYLDKGSKKNPYKVIFRYNGITKNLGHYDSIDKAKNIYANYKYKYYKELLYSYKDYIPKNTFNKLDKVTIEAFL